VPIIRGTRQPARFEKTTGGRLMWASCGGFFARESKPDLNQSRLTFALYVDCEGPLLPGKDHAEFLDGCERSAGDRLNPVVGPQTGSMRRRARRDASNNDRPWCDVVGSGSDADSIVGTWQPNRQRARRFLSRPFD